MSGGPSAVRRGVVGAINTYRDAPEIDGCLFFEAPYEIISGTILPVLVTDANGYDLIGEILPEEDD